MVWDPRWEEIHRSQAWGKYPSEDVVRFVARNYYRVPDRKTIKILEVGCGTGANLRYVASEGFQAYGIDGSPTAARRCHEELHTTVPTWRGEVIVGDAQSLPYQDEFFDAAIDNECIYANLYEDSQQIYQEIHRVLRPQGMLFSKMFATGSAGDGTGTHVAANTWLVSDGPLANKGISRFTSESDIEHLLAPLSISSIERVTRTEDNRRTKIIEWLVYAQKTISRVSG